MYLYKRVERRLKKMRINFKKISAIAASALMAGMTMGVAAAANYPNPFVVSGAANVAVVYGTGAGVSSLDLVQAGNIQANLQSYMTGSSAGSASIVGEAIGLDTTGKRIYVNTSMNTVKSILTKSDLPTVLADTSFSGNVDATATQTISLGSNPMVTFAKQPTGSDDPNFGLSTSTSSSNYIYNATATFSKAINFTSADSKGQDLTLFGQKYTVSSSTDATSLVLLQSAQKIDLSSASSRTADVTIAGQKYTIDLVATTGTTATIKVTDASGASDTKTVTEASSKKIQGITIAVTSASSSTASGDSASVVAGADKVTLTSGSSVTFGDTGTVIDGTKVDFGTGGVGNLTTINVAVFAPSSDLDALKAGTSFVDPVFKSFQLNFAGMNIADDSTARDTISVIPNSASEMAVTFTDYNQNVKTIVFAENLTSATTIGLMSDSSGHNISVVEGQKLHTGDYAIVGNENTAKIVKVSSPYNATSSYTSDTLKFQDVMSGEVYATTFSAEGVGTVVIGGQTYNVRMQSGSSSLATESYNVTIDYADSTGADLIVFPSIQTSKGAKLIIAAPVTINLSSASYDGTQINGSNIKIANGNGYSSFAIGANYSVNGALVNTTLAAGASSTVVKAGPFYYNVTSAGTNNSVKISPISVAALASQSTITSPTIAVIEEKDYNGVYNGFLVDLETAGNLGVNSIKDTWTNASSSALTLASNTKQSKRADYYGAIGFLDSSATDAYTASISYPDDQIYAQLYMAANGAVISAAQASGATQLGDVLVKDSEVSAVSSKNLIVVGGSCINSVAAGLLGATCGSDFTTKTGIGSGQFLIQSIASTYSTGKIALVVAGYEAADTVNAATYLRTQTVDTTAGKKYQGTSATAATLVTTTA
ncbi:Uncharacterised protein [uncultured archaeon]|nr:Uncharacterised protein [uncultured archaeon]